LRPLRVGIDLVAADEVAESIAQHGERYLSRTYTEAELMECGGDPVRLALHFAAKEAVLKALEPEDTGIPWTSIGILGTAPPGQPEVVLTGAAAEVAGRRGITEVMLSFTQTRGCVAAVAMVLADRGSRG